MRDTTATSQVGDGEVLSDAQANMKALIGALRLQLAGFEHIDWQGLAEQDPDHAAELWAQFQSLEQTLDQAQFHHAEAEQQDSLEAHRRHADRLLAGHTVLARELPGWSPQLARQLGEFGQGECGFSADELSSVTDPKMVKLLHRAFAAHQQAQPGRDTALADAPDTHDFKAFEKLADARLKPAR